jgi:hypothetical protein
LAYRYHLGTAAAAATLLPTMASLYLAWAAFRAGQLNVASGRDLGQVADDLMRAVDEQWREEARLRRLNDPYPLPVT